MRTWPSGQPLRVALAGLLTATSALPAGAIEPPPPANERPAETAQAEALRLFREAKALYTAGRPREAAAAFERSFAAAASPEAAYNAALAHDKAEDDPIATLMWFRRYLGIARQDTDPSYPLALARAEELRARVAELRVELPRREEVREIRVNGQPVPIDSFPRVVLPGLVVLRFIGGAADQVVDISSETRAGETATIYFPGFAKPVVKPSSDPRPLVKPPPVDPKPAPRLRSLKIAFWSGTGVTGASAVLLAVFGGLALREQSTYRRQQEACETDCTTSLADRDAHRLAADRYEDYTNVMIGVTAGLAAVTLGLGLAALRESRRPRASTRAGHQFLPGPNGFMVAF
jgi:hypothetical protein